MILLPDCRARAITGSVILGKLTFFSSAACSIKILGKRLRSSTKKSQAKIRQEMYSRHEIPLKPNNAPYPAKLLNFSANVFNKKARAFFERHGASVIEPAFESLADISGKTVMTTRYCIRYQLDLCPVHQKPEQTARQPLRLKDGHHTYRLVFDCKQCRMFVILEE